MRHVEMEPAACVCVCVCSTICHSFLLPTPFSLFLPVPNRLLCVPAVGQMATHTHNHRNTTITIITTIIELFVYYFLAFLFIYILKEETPLSLHLCLPHGPIGPRNAFPPVFSQLANTIFNSSNWSNLFTDKYCCRRRCRTDKSKLHR